MSSKPILDTLARVLGEIKKDPSLVRRITPATDLLADVGLDSLELTELMLRLEEELGADLDVSQFDLRYLRRTQELVEFLSRAAAA